MQLHILESYYRFDEPECITLHFATLKDICQSSDRLMRLLMSSCNCEHSDYLITLPETLLSSANLRMEFLMLLFTKRLGNVLATCNVSVSVSSLTHNVSVSSQTQFPTSRSRLGLAHLRLGSRLGLGRKGLVHIPGYCYCFHFVVRLAVYKHTFQVDVVCLRLRVGSHRTLFFNC